MSNKLQEMTQDIQARVRELAYMMWESAGRQQGMAMAYWLKAECELLSTMQTAAGNIAWPREKEDSGTPEPTAPPAPPAIEAQPAAAIDPLPAAAQPTPAPVASPAASPAVTPVLVGADKSASRKPPSRSKVKV